LTQSDARLVAFAHAGHERAFEALVQRYRRPLLGYCRRLLLSPERAEDALQQALLQAWLSLRAGTEVGDVKPWLYRIVHNSALNTLRVAGYDYCKLSESLSGADAPEADLDRRIAVREALAGLAALPEMQREALLRTAVEGRTHQQVARDLGLSENALRGLVYRARSALRTAAGALVPPPLLTWALGSGGRGAPLVERLAELGAGGGSAGVAGLLMKGGAAAVTASVLAGGIATVHGRPGSAHESATAHIAPPPQPTTGTQVALAPAHPASDVFAHARDAPRAQVHGTRSRAHAHQPGLRAKSVKPKPTPMPFTTAIAPPPPPAAPLDTGGSDRQGIRDGGQGRHDGQRSESRGVIEGTVQGTGDPGSTVDGGHGEGSPEQDGEAGRGSAQDGSTSSGRTSGGDRQEPAEGGGGQRANPSNRTPTQGAAQSEPGGTHDHEGSSETSPSTRVNSSPGDHPEPSSGAPSSPRSNGSPKGQPSSSGASSTARTDGSSKDRHGAPSEGSKRH
jgi:RNA polymerase sigma factor (sigma-70 family)